jgi:signal transduction histidine kinase
MHISKKLWQKRLDASYLPLIIAAIITAGVVLIIYYQTQALLKERLQERLTAIAGTAALQFNEEEINAIRIPEDLQKDIAKIVANKMKKIRENNSNVKYVYILRPTESLAMTSFIIDADTIEPVDWDENGQIDEIEIPPFPGEDYDVSEIPAVIKAYSVPTATDDLYTDKWGTFLSGFAPIKNAKNETIAVIGIDVQVDDFFEVIRATLIPFLLLICLLLLILTIQTTSLIRIWENRVELVKELDIQKDELLSIVSHQLAAPVTALKWYLEILLDGDIGSLTKEQQNQIHTMQSVTSNLSDLVSMILDVSRIQLGRMRVEPQETDMEQLISEINEVIIPKATEKFQDYIVNIDKKIPIAKIDKRLTRMAIENLLTNAVKYTPEKGKINLTINFDRSFIHIRISDTGFGIPKSEQGQLFQKLFRASNVRNSIEGNGFGLYVAKGSIESQNGSIWFESEVGRGTTFYIKLPIFLNNT